MEGEGCICSVQDAGSALHAEPQGSQHLGEEPLCPFLNGIDYLFGVKLYDLYTVWRKSRFKVIGIENIK